MEKILHQIRKNIAKTKDTSRVTLIMGDQFTPLEMDILRMVQVEYQHVGKVPDKIIKLVNQKKMIPKGNKRIIVSIQLMQEYLNQHSMVLDVPLTEDLFWDYSSLITTYQDYMEKKLDIPVEVRTTHDWETYPHLAWGEVQLEFK